MLDLSSHIKILDAINTAIWIYDPLQCRNLWGNSAALKFFGVTLEQFMVCQNGEWGRKHPERQAAWEAENARYTKFLEGGDEEVECSMRVTHACPGFLALKEACHLLYVKLRPLDVMRNGQETRTLLIQVAQDRVDYNSLRMAQMCNNHPLYQFMFDADGQLIAANNLGLVNLKQHLGARPKFTLKAYLEQGIYDGGSTPECVYREAMDAIFVSRQPCHRFPQMRWSKRHPGKFKWVLYEMWPMTDPITGAPAVLVCEQNITQVKAVEEQFRSKNSRLEAQLEEALSQRGLVHTPTIDIDTPADKTLKMLDKIMRGEEVSPAAAMELHDAIMSTGNLLQPVNFNEQIMTQGNKVYENEVGESLIQLLSSRQNKVPGDSGSSSSEAAKPQLQQSDARSSGLPLAQIQSAPRDEVMAVLATADAWQFDAFKLNEVANGRPLSLLGYALLQRFNVVDTFGLDPVKLAKFLMRVEDGYPSNPYHNRIHAADVLRSLHVLVIRGGLLARGFCDDITLLACYLSAIVHDYEHKGVNNDYLVRVGDSLALTYNDRSPMENHHLAAAFQLMRNDEFNFLARMSAKSREALRKQMIEMVLATDMKQHFAIHSMFQTKMQTAGSGPGSRSSPHHSATGDAAGTHKPVDDDLKSLVMQVALKCCDLGHLTSPRAVHRRWVAHLEEELFKQGDSEKAAGLAVSPLMDRDKHGITKSQVGFFDIVAMPLFQTYSAAFPEAGPMLDAVKDNYAMWREEAMASASRKSK